LEQAVAELPGRDACDHLAELASAAAVRGADAVPLTSLGASFSEVQVLNDDGAGAVPLGGRDEGADRGPQPPVPGGGGQSGQV
jgi:hypothetical protein